MGGQVMAVELHALGKIPPHSIEGEQSVLGSMLLDKDAIVVTTETLQPDDFYKEAHKEIYEAILELYNRDEPVDLVTLSDELKNFSLSSLESGIKDGFCWGENGDDIIFSLGVEENENFGWENSASLSESNRLVRSSRRAVIWDI